MCGAQLTAERWPVDSRTWRNFGDRWQEDCSSSGPTATIDEHMDVSRIEQRRRLGLIGPLALMWAALGCQTDDERAPSAGTAGAAAVFIPEAPPITDAVDVALNRPELCERAGEDSVRDMFCADE